MGILWLPAGCVPERRSHELIVMLVVPWADDVLGAPGNDLRGKVQRRPDGILELLMRVPNGDRWVAVSAPLHEGNPVIGGEDVQAWGLARIGATVWAVQPSLKIEGQLHAFVVLRDVPDPEPWREEVR